MNKNNNKKLNKKLEITYCEIKTNQNMLTTIIFLLCLNIILTVISVAYISNIHKEIMPKECTCRNEIVINNNIIEEK